jgi:Family of unknown function (DUF6328)
MADDAENREGSGNAADSEESRLDRELIELLNELRVVLPGVQVLFAFLLTVPFTNRFNSITPFQRDIYFGILVLAAIATALFLTPTAFHRIRFRQRDKEALLQLGNRMVILGMGALGTAIAAALYLIADLVFSRAFAVTTGVVGLVLLGLLWYALPLVRRARDPDRPDEF